jgi:membrane protease YdiL (CAAX protease family)
MKTTSPTPASSLTLLPPSGTSSAQPALLVTLLLHLLPGISIGVFYWLVAPFVVSFGFPAEFALLLGLLFVGIPLEMGLSLWMGYQRSGKWTLHGVIHYTGHMPFWHYARLFVPILIYALALAVVLSPVQGWLATNVFFWLPPTFLPQPDAQVVTGAVIVTALFDLVLDGILNPIVEECYFRGLLLPRLARLGWYAPCRTRCCLPWGMSGKCTIIR